MQPQIRLFCKLVKPVTASIEVTNMAKILRIDKCSKFIRSAKMSGESTADETNLVEQKTPLNGLVNGINYDGHDVVEMVYRSLQGNNVVGVPTDTIYGVAGLAQSAEAVEKIYKIKARSSTNPVAICVGDIEDVKRWGHVTIEESLLRELLPGPVTVIFERTADLNPKLNPDTNLVGIRIPDHDFIRALARRCQAPIALTSANISGSQSTLRIQEFQSLWPQLGVVVDGGVLGNTAEARLGSTVVDLSQPSLFTIKRPGSARDDTVAKLKKHGLTEAAKT